MIIYLDVFEFQTYEHCREIQTCNFQEEMLEWLDGGNYDLPCCESGREIAIGRHINSDRAVVDEVIGAEGDRILFFVIPQPEHCVGVVRIKLFDVSVDVTHLPHAVVVSRHSCSGKFNLSVIIDTRLRMQGFSKCIVVVRRRIVQVERDRSVVHQPCGFLGRPPPHVHHPTQVECRSCQLNPENRCTRYYQIKPATN